MDDKKPPLLLSSRMLVSTLVLFGFTNLYMQRIGLSVAIVCMVNHTTQRILTSDQNNSGVKFSDCDQEKTTENMEDGELAWSKTEQGLVLGSFFWGYLGPQVFGGVLAMRFGGKVMFAIPMFVGSLATILTPPMARFHFTALIAVRVVIGFCSGIAYPAPYSLFSTWMPPSEQNRLIGAPMAGPALGTVLAMVFGGLLCRFGFAGGWPSVFYVFGGLGVLWCILWTFFVSDTPRENRWISEKERLYIEWSLKDAISNEKRHIKVPWRSIFTSRPVWAMFLTHVMNNWTDFMFTTQLPTYLREVLGFSITENGSLSALPSIFAVIVTVVVSLLADWLLEKKIWSRNICRKFFQALGQLPLITLAVALTFLSCSQKVFVIIFLVIGIAFCGSHQGAGFMLTPADLAPQYSTVIFSVSNTLGAMPGIVVPSVVGAMTPQRTREQWNNVFYVTAAISALSCLTFLVFSSAELQDWARPPEMELNMDEKTKEEEEALV